MYCNKCGKKNPAESKFCKNCGVRIDEDIKETTASTVVTKEKKNSWGLIIGIAALVISYVAGRAFGGTFGLIPFLLIVGWLVGYYFAKWFIKNHPDSKFFSIVAWLNVISWISPIAGLATAGVTYVFGQQKKQTKYNVLWVIAVVLALANALLYPFVANLNNQTVIKTLKETYTNSGKTPGVTGQQLCPYVTSNPTGLSKFKVDYKQSFIESCSKTVGNSPQCCGCIAEYMITNYTEAELIQFYQEYNSTHKTPSAIQHATEVCYGNKTNSK